MAFDYLPKLIDPLYPLTNDQNERILIEFNGILHSEAEDIFYGLKECPYLDAYPFTTYERLLSNNPESIYEEIGYFRPKDLLKYLNDGQDIDSEDMSAIINYCIHNYDYSVSTMTNIYVGIKRLIESDFVKSITIVLTNNRKLDGVFLLSLFSDKKYQEKVEIINTNNSNLFSTIIAEILEASNSELPYTTFITNEYTLIEELLINFKTYKTDTAFFLLRNHSQNMKYHNDNGIIKFDELYTNTITELINGPKANNEQTDFFNYPVRAKFARFSPAPFRYDSPNFMTFGFNNPTE